MNRIERIDPERLSHAYVIESSREEGLSHVRELMGHLGVRIAGNPDYHEYLFDTFLIDDARALRREQGMHGSMDGRKVFVIAFNAIGIESQHALLKTLEEPTSGTHFFFIARSAEMLLPTVRSRVQIIRAHAEPTGQRIEGDAEKFLSSSIPERMKHVERMTKVKADDRAEAKEEARSFLSELEPLLYKRFVAGDAQFSRSLEDVISARRELAGRAPSLKLLLETLALTIPVQ